METTDTLSASTTSKFRQNLRRFGRLFAIKPVLIIYGLQYAITGPVTRYNSLKYMYTF
jgi:hypothetical protein